MPIATHTANNALTMFMANDGKQGDECGGLAEFESDPSFNYSFSNFSFKVNGYLNFSMYNFVFILFSLLFPCPTQNPFWFFGELL